MKYDYRDHDQEDVKQFANTDGCFKRVLYTLCAVVLSVVVIIYFNS